VINEFKAVWEKINQLSLCYMNRGIKPLCPGFVLFTRIGKPRVSATHLKFLYLGTPRDMHMCLT